MAKRVEKLNIRNSVAKLLSSISDKNREVLERRFGIDRNGEETLESIGKSYKITRERVRQIQEYGLKKLVAGDVATLLVPAFNKVEEYIIVKGGVAKATDIFEVLAKPKEQAHLAFVLRLMPNLITGKETDDLHTRFAVNSVVLKKTDSLVSNIHTSIGERKVPMSFTDLMILIKDEAQNSSNKDDTLAENILPLSKRIKKGPFGDYGLAEWPSIAPRGVRDRAHLVFEKEKRPLHFKEISELIDKHFISSLRGKDENIRRTHPQTVHNELIKDPRFVLIGRGLYALSEWGYEPGTVKDVLVQILKDSGKALHKEDVLQLISERRFVKPNTVFLNLQNKHYFKKLDGGKYYLA